MIPKLLLKRRRKNKKKKKPCLLGANFDEGVLSLFFRYFVEFTYARSHTYSNYSTIVSPSPPPEK